MVLHFFLRDFWAIERVRGTKEYKPTITLAGQRTFVTNQYTGSDFINFQVVFQPAALFQLTGIPAHELTDQILDATTLFPGSVCDTFGQMQEAKSYSELLVIGENFVKTLLKHKRKDSHPLNLATRQLMYAGGNISLDWLAQEACLCTKQFKRKFNERIGVNPKLYAHCPV